MSEQGIGIIEFPVKLTAAGGEDIDDIISKLTGDGGKKEGKEKEAMDKVTELLEGVDDKGLKTLKGLLSNPEAFTEAGILTVLSKAGPYGAIAVALIAIILTAPELYKQIVKILGMKGGPLNMDFRYTEEQQFNQSFDRELQFRRAMAVNPVITDENRGFVAIDPAFEGNSLIEGHFARMNRIGINLSSYGYVHGI